MAGTAAPLQPAMMSCDLEASGRISAVLPHQHCSTDRKPWVTRPFFRCFLRKFPTPGSGELVS